MLDSFYIILIQYLTKSQARADPAHGSEGVAGSMHHLEGGSHLENGHFIYIILHFYEKNGHFY